MPTSAGITPAQLQWRNGTPYAADYGDIYFSDNGIDEVRRVFIAPAQIEERLSAASDFCIGELGFGMGLNFAVCAEAALAKSATRLHFISFEKHPLDHRAWSEVADRYGTQLPIYQELCRQTLPVLPGWHRRVLAGGRITLSVFHGDAADGLEHLRKHQANPIDAWFLDGFAPDRNESMWRQELYDGMGRITAKHGTATTFTSAGRVRRGLQAAGFDMHRVDQRPHKRESLAGLYRNSSARNRVNNAVPVQVHGAGIAGASVARHLAERDVDVQVYDPLGVGGGASGIHTAVLHPRLLGDGSASADFRAAAFHYASNYLQRFNGFDTTGVIQLQGPNLNERKLQRICNAFGVGTHAQDFWLQRLDATGVHDLSGLPGLGEALYFPTGGVVNLPSLCSALLDHPRIEVITAPGPAEESVITVLCTGAAVRNAGPFQWLEIAEVFGQLDRFAATIRPTLPIVGNGYVVPEEQGCTLGATFEYEPWNPDEATAHNLRTNAHLIDQQNLDWLGRTRGPRAASSDRTPVIGKLQEHIWTATAFGSMGSIAAPWAADVIASSICGWLTPWSERVENLVRPERFIERQARRGIRHGQGRGNQRGSTPRPI